MKQPVATAGAYGFDDRADRGAPGDLAPHHHEDHGDRDRDLSECQRRPEVLGAERPREGARADERAQDDHQVTPHAAGPSADASPHARSSAPTSAVEARL